MENRSGAQHCKSRPCFAWSSIVQGTRNWGNHLIEWALRRALDLPEPVVSFNSFEPMNEGLIRRINTECDFVLSPGCTTLQVGQNRGYLDFDQLEVPKPCFGGCFWESQVHSKLTMVARAVGPAVWAVRSRRCGGPLDLRIARMMSQPIGSRDPYTHEVLCKGGLSSRFIGCPTLLAETPPSRWAPVSGNRLVVSLSRTSLPTQLGLILRLRRWWRVSVLIHEPYEQKLAKWLMGVRIVTFETPEQFMGEYSQADLVLTGRLHGALPAVRFGRPVIFFGDPQDTRLSLLSFLGLTIHRLSKDLAEAARLESVRRPPESVLDRAFALREAFIAYAGEYGIATRLCTQDAR